MSTFIFILCSLFITAYDADHEFYVSVIEVKHDIDEQNASVKFRIFSDDLQVALQSEYSLPTPPLVGQICSNRNNELSNFLKHHVSIAINGHDLMPSSENCAAQNDVHEIVWTYDHIEQLRSFSILADYLMDIYPNQTQMVHLSTADQKRTMRLTRKSPEGVIDFQN